MGNLVDKVKNGALILGAVATLGLGSCKLCGVDPVPEDTTKPVITLMGDNPYNTVVGDPFIEQGYNASDDTDGDVTGYVSRTSNDDVSNSGNYLVKYNVSDEAGNQADEKTRTIQRSVETSELEDMLNAETIMDKAGGGKMTVLEAARSLGFDLYRGTNDNVADNIEGSYLASGSWVSNVSSTPYSYTNVPVEFSEQGGFSVDKVYASTFNFNNAVLTGFEDGETGIVHSWDFTSDNEGDDSIVLSDANILSNGDLSIDRLELFLYDEGGPSPREWIRYIETLAKQ